uniref:ANF_receptor domain-containing protein n=1 Tax=Caenorhabditis tropicalis TaxID=1561998 RepID=A0A1I7UTM6_9PELO
MFAHHMLDIFKKPSIHVLFSDPTQPAVAFEFMKMLNQRQRSHVSLEVPWEFGGPIGFRRSHVRLEVP